VWIRSTDWECSIFNQPEYTEDPGGYWDWYDNCIVWTDDIEVDPGLPPIPCKPRMWIDSRGRCWKIVCTEFGPQLESCGGVLDPLPVEGAKLRSVGFGPKGIELGVLDDRGIQTQIIPAGKVPISKLAFALLAGAELPTAQITDIDADYWDRMPRPEAVKGGSVGEAQKTGGESPMGAIEEIKSLLDGTFRQRYGEGYPDRVDAILGTMMKELESRSGLDRTELERRITRFELILKGAVSREGESYTRVAYMASQDGGGHEGPFDWIPHDCHLKIDLCWPFPDEEGNIYCLQVELPWFCPDAGPITIPPIGTD
jgi:hypothetical protein